MAGNKHLNRLKVVLVEKGSDAILSSVSWRAPEIQPPLEMLMKTTKLLDVDLNALVRIKEL